MFADVTIDLAKALICFASVCHPALVGQTTPTGEFQLQHYSTSTPGYGGDILIFKELKNEVFGIHRVLDLPGEQRIARLRSPYARHRVNVTNGCVNVTPEVYDELILCCYASKVIIK